MSKCHIVGNHMSRLMCLFYFNRVDPFYASAHNNIGIILENRTEAEVHFRETLKIAPSHLGAHVNLGNLLL